MSKYEYLRAEPYVSMTADSANKILQDFETELGSVDCKLESVFYDNNFASDCEHQAWLLWLKANIAYHGVGYHLSGYNK